MEENLLDTEKEQPVVVAVVKSLDEISEEIKKANELFGKSFEAYAAMDLVKSVIQSLEEIMDILEVCKSPDDKYPFLVAMEETIRVSFGEFLTEINALIGMTADLSASKKRKVARGKDNEISHRLKLFAGRIRFLHSLMSEFPDLSQEKDDSTPGDAQEEVQTSGKKYDLDILKEDVMKIIEELEEAKVTQMVSMGDDALHDVDKSFNGLSVFHYSKINGSSYMIPHYLMFGQKKMRKKLLEQHYYGDFEFLQKHILSAWNFSDWWPMVTFNNRFIPSVPFQKKVNIQIGDSRSIPCYFLSQFRLDFKGKVKNEKEDEQKVYETNECDTVIIHYHGGGFMAMTPVSHMCYIKRWSNETGYPVLSPDYTLSTDAPFPAAVQDCYDVLQWVDKVGPQHGIPTKRIVLVGDSAGGNLVAAVTLKSIVEGTRVPDKVVMAYPALQSSYAITPSRLYALNDVLLSIPAMRICASMYAPDKDTYKDVYYSPLFATDEILKKFPETHFSVGYVDPLRDDVLLFAYRLWKLGIPVKGLVCKEFAHGYLNMVVTNKSAKKCMEDMIPMLK